MSTTISNRHEVGPFEQYKQVSNEGLITYAAGFPHYPRNFSRDTIKAGIIASNPALLASQLEMSARHQGEGHDPMTGEVPGRIHHEVPGVALNGGEKYTTYNACDTTSLFLIGTEGLRHIDNVSSLDFVKRRKENLQRAVEHVLSNIGEDNLFWERPVADGYALNVTYWKDSILPHANGKIEPVYPVVFAQAHFIAARGLLSASLLLNNPSLSDLADKMFKSGIQTFIRPDSYTVYRDAEGELHQSSSDELHSLAYIPKVYAKDLPLDAIVERARSLATPFGYLCTPREIAMRLSDNYHGDTVWVFEQAMIHYGATKFDLHHEAETAASVTEHIGEGQELIGSTCDEEGNTTPIAKGNDRQLWSTAASVYFAGHSLLLHKAWL